MKPYERLLDHNIKPSMQRIAIMQYLMEHPIHPSAVIFIQHYLLRCLRFQRLQFTIP